MNNALATRCAQCGTSFRVSEEQLAVSDGYVRCGRCDAVFNARESLFDLELGASGPMPLEPVQAPPAPPAAVDEPSSDLVFDTAAAAAPTATGPETEPELEPEPEPLPPDEPHWAPEALAAPEPAAGDRAEPRWEAEVHPTQPPPEPALETGAGDDDANDRLRELLGVQPGGLGEPSAEKQAPPAAAPVWASLAPAPARRRRAPGSRWLLGVGGLMAALLALALPLQWAWVERDALRARSPQLDQLLTQYLPQLPSHGWRRLDGLSVGSSSLQATPQGGAYQLELELQNRAAHALAMPWLDLSLSDAQGKLLMRRALSPQELGVDTSPLPPGGKRRIQTVFRLGDKSAPVAGYELGLFHP